MKIRNLFKKLHSEKGLTGADIATSIVVIVLTVGIVTSIYINTTNKSKEGIRYSAATRIATQIVENIQSMTYEELLDIINEPENYENETIDIIDSDEKILSGVTDSDGNDMYTVSIPTGYTAKITVSSKKKYDLDIIRDITIEVTYKISNKTKSISLSTVKQRELLEQTNEPDLNELEEYSNSDSSKNYYPIIQYDSQYVIVEEGNSEWYNYDDYNFAMVLCTSYSYSVGNTVSTRGEDAIYYWIPRYAKFSVSGSDATFGYCYKASDYRIQFSQLETNGKTLFGYMIKGLSDSTEYYVEYYEDSGFSSDDGLTGIWVEYESTEYNKYISARS